MKTVALGDVVSVAGGGTPRKSNPEYFGGSVPWVTPKDMKSRIIDGSQVMLTERGVQMSPAKLVPTNSVLVVVRSGVLKHTLPVALTARPVTLNQDMKALIPSPEIDGSYLARLVKSLQPRVLTWVRATTADNFPINKLLEHRINLPSLDDQRRIASILDQADALRIRFTEVIDRYEELLQAVFLDMFGGKTLDTRPLSDVVQPGTIVTYGST
ncbi:MAG: restriction endonuclease subunit S [Mycobacterium sp.]|nr:restriction endonuclease subunit S [Mycobacterium sp.]